MVSIYFYSISEARNKLDKTLDYPTILKGVINTNVDVSHPTIRVKASSVVDYNYCYIPALRRYYFIDSVDAGNAEYYVLNLTVDVLMTYKTDILALYGLVTSGVSANPYMDGYINSYDVRRTKTTLEFENNFNEDGTMILITTIATRY